MARTIQHFLVNAGCLEMKPGYVALIVPIAGLPGPRSSGSGDGMEGFESWKKEDAENCGFTGGINSCYCDY